MLRGTYSQAEEWFKFITTDKDNELRMDINHYILIHVIDCTFVTDPQKYDELIKVTRKDMGLEMIFATNLKDQADR
ncbi:MAG: hypothetical protein DRJ47_07440 [Thermoprotei archaeon]|nr:MAG: hypothetical protein DRJ47_07440 [Thermoprotei archaeon]